MILWNVLQWKQIAVITTKIEATFRGLERSAVGGRGGTDFNTLLKKDFLCLERGNVGVVTKEAFVVTRRLITTMDHETGLSKGGLVELPRTSPTNIHSVSCDSEVSARK